MSRKAGIILTGVIGLLLTILGIADILFTDPVQGYMSGEDQTVSFYLYIGVPLLIISIIGLVRDRKSTSKER